MNLNEAAQSVYETAKKRGQYKDDGNDVLRALKHCAGEVIEACEQYNDWTYLDTPKNDNKKEFSYELADIILCVLSISGYEQIDIENALKEKMQINEQRAQGGNNGKI